MAQLIPKWNAGYFWYFSIFDFGPILLESGFQKRNFSKKKKGHVFVKIYSKFSGFGNYVLFAHIHGRSIYPLCINEQRGLIKQDHTPKDR